MGAEAEPAADPYEAARGIVLRQLAMGPRTRAQLARAMARRAVPEEVAQAVLDRFTEVDLIDDQAFAQAWVRSRQSGRHLARRALAHELRQRGVAEELVREAVSEVSADDELAAARALVRRRLLRMSDAGDTGPEAAARRSRRLLSMLARKGYGPGVAAQAVREVTGELVGDGDG